MSGGALGELEAKAITAFLIKEGGSPAGVCALTGVSLNWATGLARELGGRRKPRFPRELRERLWATQAQFLETSLFGMCLDRLRRTSRQSGGPGGFVAAYCIYRMFARATGDRADRLSVEEALLFHQLHSHRLVRPQSCELCRAGTWVPKGRPLVVCPSCGHRQPGSGVLMAAE
jgi:hypothetical protein